MAVNGIPLSFASLREWIEKSTSLSTTGRPASSAASPIDERCKCQHGHRLARGLYQLPVLQLSAIDGGILCWVLRDHVERYRSKFLSQNG